MISLKRTSLVAAVASAMVMSMGAMALAGEFCNFDDLTLEPESHGPENTETSFTSGDWSFPYDYNASYDSWSCFSYSNMTDTTTPGHTNDHSAITGAGVGGSSNYAVYFQPFGQLPVVSASGDSYGATLDGFYVTNTTYAYLSMRDGDEYAKQFGGETGNDEDWFKLTITGVDENSDETGTVEFYLADFRFADNSQDYIVNEWTWVDLSSLGDIAGLTFALSSSDVGDFGMNTPAYFAMDGVSVPEPGTLALLGSLAVLGLLLRRRKA